MAKNLDFYQSTDNYEDIVLLEANVVIDSVTITSIKVDVDGVIIDSAITPSAFVFPIAVAYKGATVNGVRMNLSAPGTITKLNKKLKSRIIIFTLTYPNGLVWDDNIVTVVRRAPQ